MEQTWSAILQKHFADRKWKKYYRNIIFYTLCVNSGLKPSFLWDFGPHSITPEQTFQFVKDLKESQLISSQVIVIVINDTIFISNSSRVLKQKFKLINLTKNEKDWALLETNEFVSVIIPSILTSVKSSHTHGMVQIKIPDDDCLPCVFGLLLGYPLIYYYNLAYPETSLSLKVYKLLCKFQFLNESDEFLVSSFSIPMSVDSDDVETFVNEWYNNLRTLQSDVFHSLRLECTSEFVNSLNL